MNSLTRQIAIAVAANCLALPMLAAEDSPGVAALKSLDTQVLTEIADEARQAVRRDVSNRLKAANRRETELWRKLDSREAWEKYRDERIAALRESLGLPEGFGFGPVSSRVMSELKGDGFSIQNLQFASRHHTQASANLYRPAEAKGPMPGIIICHSHHAPKTQSELQTMGITWARQGALVLVMDQLGHGERRLHSFSTKESYQGSFRPERQDYYFRYNTGVQLQLVGESLIGWMAEDLSRGVTLLLEQKGIDRDKIILLGAVAGGGDPAAVAAALDKRIAAVAPFNFGGYEPEDAFPLPDDAEDTFNYSGSGSWESTRNSRLSARDGFFPWVIVGSLAPRRLVYAHEFRWDQPRDPVWKRLLKIYEWQDTPDRLAFALGSGTVKGSSAQDSHCTNIGRVHRAQLYKSFDEWFSMTPPAEESNIKYTAAELSCGPVTTAGELYENMLGFVLIRELPIRDKLLKAEEPPDADPVRDEVRDLLTKSLGSCKADERPEVTSLGVSEERPYRCERIRIDRRSGDVVIPLPLVLLSRKKELPDDRRVVVGIAQPGKAELLRQRPELVAGLLERNAWVVLVDLRGTGETQPKDEGRGRTGGATSRSSSEWMLGQTVLGQQVGDLRTVLAYLRTRVPAAKFSLWGEGLVPPNNRRSDDADLSAPLDAADLPRSSEPLGQLAGLFTAILEPDVATVFAAGGLSSYADLLRSPYFYVPHDAIVPGILQVADIYLLERILTPRRTWFPDSRDAQNRANARRPPNARVIPFLLGYVDDSPTKKLENPQR